MEVFWYDGQLREEAYLTMGINDPAWLYGATVFTTLRVYHQCLDHPLTNWIAHCDRLKNSLQFFDWQFPHWQRLRQGGEILQTYFEVLRITIFPDGRELILGRSLPENLNQNQQQGITGWVGDTHFGRVLPHHKTGNYLGAWLALQKGKKLGAKETILVNEQGEWIETTTGNLWGYKDGYWWTPSLQNGILPGIMRSHILNHSNLPIQENIWHQNFVSELEAIAYSNCVVELIPFHTILTQRNTISLNPNHPILRQLRSCFYS